MIKETSKELKKIAKEIIEKGDSINYKDLLHRTKLIYEKLIIHNYIVSQKGKKDLDNFNLISNKQTTERLKVDSKRELSSNSENIPEFIKKNEDGVEKKKSLNENTKINDLFGKGFKIGLNDRIAFIRDLFDSNSKEYMRVISQLSTFETWEEAETFIHKFVKPDYNNWEGKESFELRFLKIIENNFL